MKEEITKYIELKLKLFKFEATEKVADIRAKLVFDIVFIFLFFCFLFFFGFTFSLLFVQCILQMDALDGQYHITGTDCWL